MKLRFWTFKNPRENVQKCQSKLFHQVISYAKKGGSALSRDNRLKRREIQISSVKNPYIRCFLLNGFPMFLFLTEVAEKFEVKRTQAHPPRQGSYAQL